MSVPHHDEDAAMGAPDERYRALFEHSSEGIWRLEFDPPIDISLSVDAQVDLAYQTGRLAECNDVMARMHGVTGATELVGKPLDFLLPASDPQARAFVAAIVENGYRTVDRESVARDAQGGTRHFAKSVTGVVVDGRLHRVWGTQGDISERKAVERALRHSEARFRLMADAAPVLLWMSGVDMGCTWFNRPWLDFAGRTLEQELGFGWVEGIHPDDAERVVTTYRSAFARHEPFTIECRLRRHDGEYRAVLGNGVPVDDHRGEFAGYIGTCTDITDQKRAAAAQAYLAAIVESADDAIVAKNLDSIIQSCNAAAERLFGYTSNELVGRSVRMLIPPDRQWEEEEILARLRKGERIEQFETVRIRKDGSHVDVSLTVSPVRDGTGAIVGASKIARDITEKKRAATAQAFLAAIVASSDDAIIAKDLNGIIQSCNGAAERVFGYSAAELIGRPVRMLIPSDRQAEEDDILARIRRGERVDHFETVRVRKDGTQIDVSLSVSPVRDGRGAIIGVSKIARDITAQKRAAAELAAQQAWFRITLGSIGDAVIACDPSGRVSFLNPAAERLTGWPQEAAVGQPLHDVFHIVNERTRQRVEDPASLVMRLGEVVGLANHTLLIARDGTSRPIADSAAPIRDGGGRMIGVVLVFRDVTDQRRAEDAIAEQREWLETTLESIADAVITTDVRGRVVFLNPVAEYLTGWRAEQARGRACTEVLRTLSGQHRGATEDPVARVLREGTVVGFGNYPVLVGRDGKERPIDESGSPIRDREGRIIGVVLVFRDVSERQRVEADRQAAAAERERLLDAERAARAEAERASRVKDEFVAMVSHELRTPLNAILGWTQLMMQRGRQDPATIERGLDIVARNTRVQAQLISDLLDISRIVAGKLQLDVRMIDLRAIVGDAVETVRQEAEARGVDIREELAEAGSVAGDPARLQQVVWNLLANAVKFTPRGGWVLIRLRHHGGDAEITVSDNGAGIRPDVLPHVFDRFHQADRSITRRFGGLGLGLSIVKHLVERHGGTVRAESAGEGRGSTFVISLPASLAHAADNDVAVPSRAQALEAVSLDAMRVLVVEDEPDTLEFLRQLLISHGAVVNTAASAAEALDIYRSHSADVIISDIGLPEVDGYDLLRRIRERDASRNSTVPAIALTAYARPEDRTRALLAGYQAHIAKPVEPSELIATIASFAGFIDANRRSV